MVSVLRNVRIPACVRITDPGAGMIRRSFHRWGGANSRNDLAGGAAPCQFFRCLFTLLNTCGCSVPWAARLLVFCRAPYFPVGSWQLAVGSGQWAVGRRFPARRCCESQAVICAIQPGGLAENSRWQAPAPPPEPAPQTSTNPEGVADNAELHTSPAVWHRLRRTGGWHHIFPMAPYFSRFCWHDAFLQQTLRLFNRRGSGCTARSWHSRNRRGIAQPHDLRKC